MGPGWTGRKSWGGSVHRAKRHALSVGGDGTSSDSQPVTGLENSLVERSTSLSAPDCPEALLNRVGEGHHAQADGDADGTGKQTFISH